MTAPRLDPERFPRASRYHPAWAAAAVSGGANPLLLTDWLTQALPLRPGMRVLDLGSGPGASSVFLAREHDVGVWSVDLWFPARERQRRAEGAGVGGRVHALRADARSLPFAAEFFDAVVAIDCFGYVGTDDLYLPLLLRHVKPGGQLGIAGAGLTAELEDGVPAPLTRWGEPTPWSLHSAGWWRRHWERSGLSTCVPTTPCRTRGATGCPGSSWWHRRTWSSGSGGHRRRRRAHLHPGRGRAHRHAREEPRRHHRGRLHRRAAHGR